MGDQGVRADGAYYSRTDADRALHHAAEGIRDVLGYGVVAISMLRDTGEYEYVAVVGPPDAREYLLGTHLAGEQLRAGMAVAETTGTVHYVPRGTLDEPGPRWSADIPGTDDPDEWHPDDELFVLLVDPDGGVRGHVGLDDPPGGRVPTPDDRRRLQAYVERMVPAVLHADAHRRIADQLRVAAQARGVVRRATARLDVAGLLAACGPELAECLRADQVWFHTEGPDGAPPEAFRVFPADAEIDTPARLLGRLRALAAENWRSHRALVVEHERVLPEGRGSEGADEVLDALRAGGLESLLMAPVGAGAEWLGMLVGVRRAGADEWSDIEVVAAEDLGRDLGSALHTARSLERERGHAAYKQQLIATIAHELKNPLTAVRGNLELLQDEIADLDGEPVVLARRIERATERLTVLVGNLLTLSEVDDTRELGRHRAVQLGPLVRDAVEVLADQTTASGIEVVCDLPDDRADAVVDGIPGELEHLVVNLLSNAVKYSEPGGRITVRLRSEHGGVVLSVADRGIGIAPDEVGRIFGEFFRSTDPAARRRPGTGLGLAIAARVAQRHGAVIDVESEPGQGTTFVVHLPRSADATRDG